MTARLDVEITIYCERVGPGCEFRALFYCRTTERFYGGSGPTALAALAWCMDEYVGHVVHRMDVMPARHGKATPGSRFPKVEAAAQAEAA